MSETGEASDSRLSERSAQVEALLLVAGEAATVETLARALETGEEQVERALAALDTHYRAAEHGIRLQRLGGRIRLATAPAFGPLVARFLGIPERTKLSPAALETLSIVAYRQPVTRPEVESIRGVNCDHVLRALLDHGLIEEQGRADTPGRPAIYGTTMTFLSAMGLQTLDDLPPLED